MKLSPSIVLLTALCVRAACGGPLQTLVVVNDQSAESLELGRYYAESRGIPDRHVFHVSIPLTGVNLDTATFSNVLEGPIRSWIATNGNPVNAVVFMRDIPYRIYDGAITNLRWSGLTASLFYGFHSSPNPFISGCSIAANSAQDYYRSERWFDRAGSPSSNRYVMAALLTASNLDTAKRLVDRSAAADFTRPTSTVFLLRTSDFDRSVRWPQFDEAAFLTRFADAPVTLDFEYADAISGRTGVVGVMTGSRAVSNLALNGIQPGAFGDHLTSFGGYLFDGAFSPEPVQMSALDWIHHGFAGAHGTVVEPCAYSQKFPDARLHYWYARGFSLGESFWMSVMNPYPGVFVGDPLCAPFARPPVVTGDLAPGTTVTGMISVTFTAISHVAVARLDAYLDNRYLGAVTSVAPVAGQQVGIVAAGVTSVHAVVEGEGLFAVAEALAAAVDASGSGLRASASGDRIQLVSTNIGIVSTGVSYSAFALPGTAGVIRVTAVAASEHLLDSTAPAREFMGLRGTASGAGAVSCVITRTNGIIATNTVPISGGMSALTIMNSLMAQVNAHPDLGGPDGLIARMDDPSPVTNVTAYLEARTPGPGGVGIFVHYTVSAPGLNPADSFTDFMNDNDDVLGGRGQVFLRLGPTSLVGKIELDTTGLSDGPHELVVEAREGTAVGSLGRLHLPFEIANHSLTCRLDAPPPMHHVLRGHSVTGEVSVAGAGTVTQVTLFAEGKTWASSNAPPFRFVVPTTSFGAGLLRLQALARLDTGVSVVSPVRTIVLFSDDDGDGVSDQWEYQHFGSATNYDGSADPDGDGVGNREEYLADSAPTNAQDFFRVLDGGARLDVVRFVSRTTRQYRIESAAGSIEEPAWQVLDSNVAAVAEGQSAWTNSSAGTNLLEWLRVRAIRP